MLLTNQYVTQLATMYYHFEDISVFTKWHFSWVTCYGVLESDIV